MKTSIFGIVTGIALTAMLLNQPMQCFAQATNNLKVTAASADEHGAITLRWLSQTNGLYRIQCTPQMSEAPVWEDLYDWYPSQGTNTFWMDTGNTLVTPDINHPHDDPARFYRLVAVGTNEAAAPSLSVTSPTNNSLLTGDITLAASISSTSAVGGLRWFVDGAEFYRSDGQSTTNAPLNTCQWRNGQHLLFAVAQSTDGGETTDPNDQDGDPKQGFGVSPIRTVTFDNFISDFRASSRFIRPQNSETQTLSAQFASYSSWTLSFIEYFSSNTVRTVTGTGSAMRYDWNGTGDGGTALADGIYRVFLSAVQTTGLSSLQVPTEPTNPLIADALARGATTYFTEPPPMPPVRVNGVWVPWEQVYGPQPLLEVPIPSRYLPGATTLQAPSIALGRHPSDPSPQDSLTSQTTELQPPRIINLFGGRFGVVYQGHHPGGILTTNPSAFAGPPDGLGGTVRINANTGPFKPLHTPSVIAQNFSWRMQNAGVSKGFVLGDDNVSGDMLRSRIYGGTEIFEQVNIGLIVGHDVYGFDPDFTISFDGPLTSYYPIYHTGVFGYDWVQLAACWFGRGPNLRWIAHLSCNNLQPDVYDDMWNKEALPIGDNLHFFMGATTVSFMVADFGTIWADSMAIGGNAPIMSIKDAWFFAGHRTQGTKYNEKHRTVIFRIAGWPNTFGDTLYEYQDPDSGNPADITLVDEQVYP